MRTQTTDGAWTFHLKTTCQHAGCEWGDVLIHNDTGDRFDISHWDHDDIDEFMSDDHHRESHAEHLERIN